MKTLPLKTILHPRSDRGFLGGMARRHPPAFICPRLCTPRAFDMFSYIAGPCRFCVHCSFATYARVVGLCGFRMHCGIYRICAYCAPLPCLRAPWGGSPLSHVPWAFASPVPALEFRRFRMCRGAFAALMPALGFRRFRMCRGPLPHSYLFLGSPLSRVPLAFAAPCLLWDFAAFACAGGLCRTRACFWNFAAFACTTAFAAPVPAVEFCHFRVHRGLMTRPRSLGALPRPCLRANATSTSAAEF